MDRALERFFRDAVPLSESAVDLSFDAPDRTWGAGLTRPTVNLFLWEIARSDAHLRGGIQQRTNEAGAIERRPSSPVLELHYLITAWANEQRDEHQLLGSLVTAIMSNRYLPEASLPEQLVGARYGMVLATRDKRVPSDFWSALDGRLKPGLQLEVSVPVEVFEWQSTATQADTVSVEAGRIAAPTPARPLSDPPALRRRRANGALVMEGKPAPDADQG